MWWMKFKGDVGNSAVENSEEQKWAHVLCLEVILKKKTFFKLMVRTHDLGHMTEAMLATAQHNHSTICPLKNFYIISSLRLVYRFLAHVLCPEVILKKKSFFKLMVRTHDLGHMTEAMLATAQHNHSTICPLKKSYIISNITCHGSTARQHKMIFPSKWYLHPN